MQSLALLDTALVSLLAPDPRPTFAVYLASLLEPFSRPIVVYCNPALLAYPDLSKEIRHNLPGNHPEFWAWVASGSSTISAPSIAYRDVIWTRIVVHNTWAVIGANDQRLPADFPSMAILDNASSTGGVQTRSNLAASDGSSELSLANSQSPSKASPGPTPVGPSSISPSPLCSAPTSRAALTSIYICRTSPSLSLWDWGLRQQSFSRALKLYPWSASPIGPMESWTFQLRNLVDQMIADVDPVAIYWGSAQTAIYNEAFSILFQCGFRFLGCPAKSLLSGTMSNVHAHFNACSRSRTCYTDNTTCYISDSSGKILEHYVRSSLLPVIDSSDQCFGFIHRVNDMTLQCLVEKRMRFLIRLESQLAEASDLKSLWKMVSNALSHADAANMFPVFILHSTRTGDDPLTAQEQQGIGTFLLEGLYGIPEDHPILSQQVGDYFLFSRYLSTTTSDPVLLQTEDGSLPSYLTHRMSWNRDISSIHRQAVLFPIQPVRNLSVAFLFLGLNPLHHYDENYRNFMTLLARILSASTASIMLADRSTVAGWQSPLKFELTSSLSRPLSNAGIQATEVMRQTWSLIPAAVYISNGDGKLEFSNEAWDRLTGSPPAGRNISDFLAAVHQEDQPKVLQYYRNLVSEPNVVFSFRLQAASNNVQQGKSASNPTSPQEESSPATERFVLASVHGVVDNNGILSRVVTCLVDITSYYPLTTCSVGSDCFGSLAESANVGIYHISVEGRLLNANNSFYELCGLTKMDLKTNDVRPWFSCVVEQDLVYIDRAMAAITSDPQMQTAELRLRRKHALQDGLGNKLKLPKCVLATFMPCKRLDGKVESYTGCLSDISLQRWRMDVAKKLKRDAVKTKQQQKALIDMTSHELRNPLSAIIHCADEIITTLSQSRHCTNLGKPLCSPPEDPESDNHNKEQDIVNVCLESAETIAACAQHQKHIVDDILTMSKMESQMLAVTPCTVDPVQVVRSAMRMFELEARRVGVDLSLAVDPSFEAIGHSYLNFDPARASQVLINLLVNAIKFTKSEPKKLIEVRIKASLARPANETASVCFIPSMDTEPAFDPTMGVTPPASDPSELVYLMIEVRDTGPGLTNEEMRSIFDRFQQANSRTHVKHGGSGLGLFISRRLTELQRGAIGVSSKPGVGSTFAFYIVTTVPGEKERKAAEAESSASQLSSLGPRRNWLHSSSLIPTVSNADPGNTVNDKPMPNGISSRALSRKPSRHLEAGVPRKILVVDDNPINRKLAGRSLQDCGFDVELASDGLEALEKLVQFLPPIVNLLRLSLSHDKDAQSPLPIPDSISSIPEKPLSPFHFVLMDMEMPVLDGLECTRYIRTLEQLGYRIGNIGSRIPIVVVSGNTRRQLIRSAWKAGCDGVMVKPYCIADLVENLQALEKRQQLGGSKADNGGMSPPPLGNPGGKDDDELSQSDDEDGDHYESYDNADDGSDGMHDDEETNPAQRLMLPLDMSDHEGEDEDTGVFAPGRKPNN